MIGAFLGLFAAMIAALFIYEMTQRAKDDRDFPAPGHFVDLGGRSLHVQCTGSSAGKTFMLEAGAGATSLDWEAVADRLAEYGRVCRYDRAGHGWSDPGPKPRSIEAIVRDLHHVVEQEADADRIVLVGHSFGGLIAQAYAREHTDRLLGILLVDAVDAEFIELYAEQSITGARTMRLGAALSPIGIPRLLGLAPAPESAPPSIQAAMKARVIRPKAITAVADESVGVHDNIDYLAALTPLNGDLPVTVISRQTDPALPFDQDWEAAQMRLAQLNDNTRHVRSESNDHQLTFTDTDRIVAEALMLADSGP